jgi:hypothetical protein
VDDDPNHGPGPSSSRRGVRATTLALGAVFVATMALYLAVRPEPPEPDFGGSSVTTATSAG